MDTTAWIKSLDFTREPEIASHVYSTRSQRGHGQWWIRGGINPKVVGCSDLGFLTRCHSVPFHPTTFHYIPLYSLYIFNHIYIYTLYIHIIYALYYIIWLYAYKKKKEKHPMHHLPHPQVVMSPKGYISSNQRHGEARKSSTSSTITVQWAAPADNGCPMTGPAQGMTGGWQGPPLGCVL